MATKDRLRDRTLHLMAYKINLEKMLEYEMIIKLVEVVDVFFTRLIHLVVLRSKG